jgi:glutamyl-Q tRNA(Asp) synthetase
MSRTNYRGRFAPSPTGLLHAGSLATALASWLDAKAVDGIWLIRMEDIDLPRMTIGADLGILQQLDKMGMMSDEPVIYQSTRHEHYQKALETLNAQRLLYSCACSRKKIADAQIADLEEAIYPGWCRPAVPQVCHLQTKGRALRVRIPEKTYIDGHHLNSHPGDFVILRNDHLPTYQLAVVVDDALQRITHIVRGSDLKSNTPRQIFLQQRLGYPKPMYLHVPVVVGENQEKLSKQNKAPVIWPNSNQESISYLHQAGMHLGLGLDAPSASMTISEWLSQAVHAWRNVQSRFFDPA